MICQNICSKHALNNCILQELEAIKARVKEMEEEAEKLKEMQKQVEDSLMSPTGSAGTGSPGIEDKNEIDNRSIYVGNVRSFHVNCIYLRQV